MCKNMGHALDQNDNGNNDMKLFISFKKIDLNYTLEL